MSRFSAKIVRDPGGYRWGNLRGHEREDVSWLFGTNIYLLPVWLNEQRKRDDCTWSVEALELPPESTYDPFVDEPALFRVFATLETKPEAIQRFANKYGDIAPFLNYYFGSGTSLSGWQQAIESMRALLAAADKLAAKQRKHAREISNFIDQILSVTPVYMTTVTIQNENDLRAATYTLLDAMKLQLIESMVEHKRYRACDQCGKPFELTPQVNRSDRIYCSDNCRVKAYQRRRKQAITMRGEGRLLRDITKATGSDMKTVKQWLQPKGK